MSAVPRSTFTTRLAIGGLAIALIGFTPTFFRPLTQGAFSAPVIVYLHGACAFAWLLTLIAQADLVRRRRVAVHRRLGWLGVAFATGFTVLGVPVGLWATQRDLASGLGDIARGQFVNILIELIVFASLVGAAIVLRRNRAWHMRLMLLATISVLGPAWFRLRHLFPGVPNPIVTFSLIADLVLVALIVREWRLERRVHPAYAIVGSAVVAVHLAELFASQSRAWLALADVLLPVAVR